MTRRPMRKKAGARLISDTQNCFLTFFTTIKLVASLDLFIAVECNRM